MRSLLKLLACFFCFSWAWFTAAADTGDSVSGEHSITDGIQPCFDNPSGALLSFDAKNDVITLTGVFTIGILDEFVDFLEQHPEVDSLVLNSEGGNVYQARGIAAYVLDRKLNTYVEGICNSACTLVFIAGHKRYIVEDATLGWHCYQLESDLAGQFVDVEKEQEKDIAFFKKRIRDSRFTDKIFSTSSTHLWQPSQAMLLEVGVVHAIVDRTWRVTR